jgi:hypothetical protein
LRRDKEVKSASGMIRLLPEVAVACFYEAAADTPGNQPGVGELQRCEDSQMSETPKRDAGDPDGESG